MSPSITEPGIARAIRQLYKSSEARRTEIEHLIRLNDLDHAVISGLHDLLLQSEEESGSLRVVSQ